MKKFVSVLFSVVLLTAITTLGYSQDTSSSTKKGDKITIAEYFDYQCPACGYFYPFVKKLMKNYGDQINLELHFFPLTSHQYGALAARAAQSAKNQGKFHEMHDMLFENQRRWASSGNPTSIFINYARKIGLDVHQFEDDLNDVETQKTIMESKAEGVRKGVNSTPTFFINGNKLKPLPNSYEGFEKAVKGYLNEKSSS